MTMPQLAPTRIIPTLNRANGVKGDSDRLYVLLPEHYRARDAEQGYPLRALLRVIAEQVEVVEDDIARLYDNWFIETCEDWVTPYIAELVGLPLSPQPPTSAAPADDRAHALLRRLTSRAEVADWIRSLRRKGTLPLLEELARTSADWPARAVEFYRLIGWHQNMNHLRPHQGGLVDLRDGLALSHIGTPFDTIARTVDIRRPDSALTPGLYNLPSVGLFLWRLRPFSVTDAPAHRVDEITSPPAYRFSAIGSDGALFHNPIRGADEADIPAEALALPIRITRRTLEAGLDDFYGKDKSIGVYAANWNGNAAETLIPADQIIVTDLSDWAYEMEAGKVGLDPETGRLLFPRHQFASARAGTKARTVKGTEEPSRVTVRYSYGFSAERGGGEYPRALTQPDHARLYRVRRFPPRDGDGVPAEPSIAAALAKWRSDRDADQNKQDQPDIKLTNEERARKERPAAVIEILDSDVYTEALNIELAVRESLILRAANETRPVLRLLNYNQNSSDALKISGGNGSRFTLDGLWIMGRGLVITEIPPAPPKTPPVGATDNTEKATAHYDKGSDAHYDADDDKGDTDDNKGDTDDTSDSADNTANDAPAILCEVRVRDCTLIPGWDLESDCKPRFPEKPSIALLTDARLIVERSVIGSIVTALSETVQEPTVIELSDSIIDATASDLPALSSDDGERLSYVRLTVKRCTIFGSVGVHAVDLAENTLFCGAVTVARRQTGCVRFCCVPFGSRTPRRFHCQPDGVTQTKIGDDAEKERKRVAPKFTSTRYGSPAYAQLRRDCAPEITGGADDASEMGAFHDLYAPQREARLRQRLADFTPEDRDAGLIFVD